MKQYPVNPPVKQRQQKFMEIKGRQLWFYTKCLHSGSRVLNWCLGCNHYSRAFQRESRRWAVSTIAVSWSTERGTLRANREPLEPVGDMWDSPQTPSGPCLLPLFHAHKNKLFSSQVGSGPTVGMFLLSLSSSLSHHLPLSKCQSNVLHVREHRPSEAERAVSRAGTYSDSQHCPGWR